MTTAVATAQGSISDDRSVRRTLKTGLWVTEAAVIAITAWSGFQLSTGHGGSAAMAAPLFLIAAVETMRVPLAGWLTRVGTVGRIGATLALGAIAAMSFEGLSLAFEQFINNRVITVSHLQHDVEKAQHSLDRIAATRTTADNDIAKRTVEVGALDASITELSKTQPTAPGASKAVCGGGRDKKGRIIPTYSCGADATNAKSYQNALSAYNDRLNILLADRKFKQSQIDAARGKATAIDDAPARTAIGDAKQALAEELLLSPMHRLAASIYGVPMSEVTEQQFNTVKKFAVFGLAGAISCITMLVSLVAHAEARREKKPGRVANALRLTLAARRKAAHRLKHRVEYRDRTVIRYLPVDVASGKVLDPAFQPSPSTSTSTPNLKVVP